jgi:hypothetical protein
MFYLWKYWKDLVISTISTFEFLLGCQASAAGEDKKKNSGVVWKRERWAVEGNDGFSVNRDSWNIGNLTAGCS